MIPLGVLASARVAAAGGAQTLTYLSTTSATGSTTGVTVTGVYFGAEAADRVIVAVVSVRTLRRPTSVTIGGVAATIDAYADNGSNRAVIARAVVPTGTTGSVVCSWSYYAVTPAVRVSTYRAAGCTVAPVDAPTPVNASNAVTSITLATTAAGGRAIVGFFGIDADTTSLSWTNAVEDAEELPYDSIASADTTGASLTITATANVAQSPTSAIIVAVAYSLT